MEEVSANPPAAEPDPRIRSQPPATATAARWRITTEARVGLWCLYAFAAYAVVRIYTLGSTHYLVLADYLSGHERLPFQKRILPVLLLEQLEKIRIPAAWLSGRRSIFADPGLIAMFAIDLSAFLVAGAATVWLYRRVAPQGRFGWLVYPIFVHATVWTYIMHTAQNFYYQYDMMSLAFFALGLCCIQARRFLPLLAVMAIGTLNRETTLFLIPIFLIDAFVSRTWERDGRVALWAKVAALCLVWLVIERWLGRHYALNDRREDYLRLWENVRGLTPQHWSEVLGGCGYLLPVVWVLRKRIPDRRIAAWLWVIPFWVAVMFCYGVLIETRIYGELCPLVAVAVASLLDGYVAQLRGPGGTAEATIARS